jgi:hypothetical protein
MIARSTMAGFAQKPDPPTQYLGATFISVAMFPAAAAADNRLGEPSTGRSFIIKQATAHKRNKMINRRHKKLINNTSALLQEPKLFVQISLAHVQPHQIAQLKRLVGDAGIYLGTPYPSKLVTFDFPDEPEADAAIERMFAAGFGEVLKVTDHGGKFSAWVVRRQ